LLSDQRSLDADDAESFRGAPLINSMPENWICSSHQPTSSPLNRAREGDRLAPDEIRGSNVQSGETRTLTKGDVIVVPNGTPHWFKAVSGPVLYYIVKVQ
jgi:Cupin